MAGSHGHKDEREQSLTSSNEKNAVDGKELKGDREQETPPKSVSAKKDKEGEPKEKEDEKNGRKKDETVSEPKKENSDEQMKEEGSSTQKKDEMKMEGTLKNSHAPQGPPANVPESPSKDETGGSDGGALTAPHITAPLLLLAFAVAAVVVL